MGDIVIQLLDKKNHNRENFDCAVTELNDYLRYYANQAMRVGASRTFVCIDVDMPTQVLGFYTLVYDKIPLDSLPKNKRRGLYEAPPVLLLARLAVDKHYQGQRLGLLMMDHVLRQTVKASEIAGLVGLAVDAKDEIAAKFYQSKYGFHAAQTQPLSLFLPVATIRGALGKEKGGN